ncbi:hypothetical protein AUJ95_05695 [Candidatus Desantisbacteria bacterium CG2_30_40_21]|uniref:AAA family ATPase n=5 Tax=unclassified Candidatus Desantisiibacteriota TaxID=3106372 RepID=A0A2M7J850_9BACT|nr:MAG: hypothetical protein AUJ95_05695 [Candidatus Desantisbacteria bacterium CG2_30_40_21]PIP42525.1 MAG: AAA family ATPase [Candidatus Desantisbacteria bacterium CG23_combo_of_CG06-09_8_20_14_all_40_23]PIX15506.1 MAG: AAA family ATPase [Candidatus Desantisbacteria bacterium CG_4_8_14_3_um_filter_40_12]PIY18977.1 MAG: AAA family ATPase [Candidatus Desantisbacteria bacterium CG_4_10_14_3_um_filter_40_18]PJB29449.1 MAG: AAA family ATPase [Candidatus Desantisbacteria bacterium CG_4_9_14_3_um_fi
MAIKKIRIGMFTVFKDIDIDFCKGINILIGENGTGKTHLLKLLYIDCDRFPGQRLRPYFNCEGVSIGNEGVDYYEENMSRKSIFIPAKEMLSHSKGLLALDRERTIPFDKTLIDIVSKAELGEFKAVTKFHEKLLSTISKIIDGEVIYENDTFYILKNNGLKIEFSMEAEGFCKFGLLWKLIRNGLLEKDTILFWDEPEANINPQLIPVLVEILLELQRNGVQIFLATHDYNLAKYFEVKQKKEDNIVYHSLFKTKSGVQYTKAVTYEDIANNPIEEAGEKLYADILNSTFGEITADE